MQRKHITWSSCFCFAILHALAVLTVFGLIHLVARVVWGPLGEFVFYLGCLLLSLSPFFGVLWCYIYVSRYNLHIPYYHCVNCGYDLTGNVSGVCPECGKRIDDGRGNANVNRGYGQH